MEFIGSIFRSAAVRKKYRRYDPVMVTLSSAPTNIRISHGDQTVKLTRNLIQSRFVFLKFEDRKFIEIEKCFYSVKVESVSFPVVPVPASNSK